MKKINLEQFISNQEKYIQEAVQWKIFVYPTNTIYWIWWMVSPDVIQKIHKAKQRLEWKHYSIIAPHFDRIKDHCLVSDSIQQERKDLRELHGPVTLLLKKKEHFDTQRLLSSNDLIGVRHLWDHPMQSFVEALGHPFITTSANISGKTQITSPDHINQSQFSAIDYCIDHWELVSDASTIINYTTKKKLVR